MEAFNQHSFVIFAVGGWLMLAVGLMRGQRRQQAPLALGIMAGALAALWLVLRPGTSSYADVDAARVASLVGQGRPVLVELYSNY
jgi:hypothetical protein